MFFLQLHFHLLQVHEKKAAQDHFQGRMPEETKRRLFSPLEKYFNTDTRLITWTLSAVVIDHLFSTRLRGRILIS